MREHVFWKNPHYEKRPALTREIVCDYLIVGGGVTGVSVAYFLHHLGAKHIVLIERDHIASGATGRAAGMFIAVPPETSDLRPFLRRYGRRKTLMYWYAHIGALHRIRHIIIRERIPCEWEDAPNLFFAARGNVEELRRDYEADRRLHQRVKLLIGRELARELRTAFFRLGEEAHHGLAINPLQYTQNLSNVLVRRGVRIYEHTPLVSERRGVAVTPHGRIRFRRIIYTTDDFPAVRGFRRLKTTIAITNRLDRRTLRTIGLLDRDMFEDWGRRFYHYARLTPDNRLLVGYGDHVLRRGERDTTLYRPHIRNIRAFIRHLFPNLRFRITYAWSGTFGIIRGPIPRVRFHRSQVCLGGGGLQTTSTLMARYAANRLFGRRQLLDALFGNRGASRLVGHGRD